MEKLMEEMVIDLYNLLDKTETGLILLDENLALLDSNQFFLDLYGFSNFTEIAGRCFTEICFTDEAEKITNEVLPQLKAEKSWSGELYGQKKTGHYFLQKLNLTLNSSGNYLAVLSEKKMALAKNMDHWCTMFDNLNDGLFKVTTKGECISINSALYRMLAYRDKEQLVKSGIFVDLVLNKFIDQKNDKLLVTLKKGNDKTIQAEIKYWACKDRSGKTLYYEGLVKDITEQERMVQDLKKSEEKYRAFFHNSGTAVMVIEEDTTISMVNKMMVELSGYRQKEIEGKMSWMELVAGEKQIERMLKYHNKRRYADEKDQVSQAYEFRFKTKNGDIKHVIANVVLLTKSLESIVSLIDITDRKQYEERVSYLAYHDQLTGLYNRDYFEEKIKELDQDIYLPLSIIMGDVNGLKLTNDAFGHKKGDQLLEKIARIIEKACRPEDIITRWGGDEFIIILPEANYELANQVRQKIQDYCIQVKTDLIQPSIALGIATKEKNSRDVLDIIKQAERWVYKNKLVEGKSIRSSILKTLEETLLEKDYETEEHAQRVKKLATKMGRALKLPNDKIDDLILLAGLHDIGKIAVNEDILLKTGPLDDDEWELIKKHSEIGYRIAKSSPEFASIAEGILYHHEKWDGSGYPTGLKGDEIPLISRIIAIVDAYDVMIHKRTYKEAIGPTEALLELQRCAGSQFDPELVHIFTNQLIGQQCLSK